ncbi:MAG: AI-2E family transporter [Candidatus Pacearchaeota archaeon]
MLTEKNFRTIVSAVLATGLFILAAITIKPIIYQIVFGILLAYIFFPIYQFTNKRIKNPNLSALLICVVTLAILLIPLIFAFNSLMKQVVEIYFILQKINLGDIIAKMTPSFLSTDLGTHLASSLNGFVANTLTASIQALTNFVLALPTNLLKLFVILFVFFFGLRDGEGVIQYLKTLSPFTKETGEQFFKHFKEITYSVLVGQIVIGILQGILAGVGYYIFGVNNVIILTLLTILVSIIPFIGAWLVWVPIDIYLFSAGDTGAALGLFIYGLVVVSTIDNILRPLIISRRTKISSAIVMIGMIGGLFVFGVLGLIIGPLILAYVLLVLEIYRKNKGESVLLEKKE